MTSKEIAEMTRDECLKREGAYHEKIKQGLYSCVYNAYLDGYMQGLMTLPWVDIEKEGLPPHATFIDDEGNEKVANYSVTVYATDGESYNITSYDFDFNDWNWNLSNPEAWNRKFTHWTILPKLKPYEPSECAG